MYAMSTTMAMSTAITITTIITTVFVPICPKM